MDFFSLCKSLEKMFKINNLTVQNKRRGEKFGLKNPKNRTLPNKDCTEGKFGRKKK